MNVNVEEKIKNAKAKVDATNEIVRKLCELKETFSNYDIDDETGEAINFTPCDCWRSEKTGITLWKMVDKIVDKLLSEID